jgi:hypothetical protein
LEDQAATVESRRPRGWRRVTGRGAARLVSSTGASDRCEKMPSEGVMVIFVHGAINTCGGWPWSVAKHTLALVAYVVVLGSPLTHSCLIVFIGSSERAILVHCIMRIAQSGTRCSSCKPVVLVTLGGCHLLDVLVA